MGIVTNLKLYDKAKQLVSFLEEHEEQPKKMVVEAITMMDKIFELLERRGR